jgi:acylphosphatase
MSSSKTRLHNVARRVLVSGTVQGVGYRASLSERARELNIEGWCRNLPDGRVEAWLNGQPEAVEELLTWMRQGPPGAAVETLDVEEQAVLEPLLRESVELFEIRK